MARILLLVTALSAGKIHAQSDHRFPLRVMAVADGELPEVYVKSGTDYVLLEFSSVQPSATVRSTYANPLPIYKRQHTSSGKDDYTITASIPLPENSKGILLLGWGRSDKADYLAFSDDFSGSGSADWLLVNGTKQTLAMQLGKGTQFVKVAPGGATPFRVMAELNKGAAVNIAEPTESNKWKTFYSTYWPIYPDRRCLVFFLNADGKIKVKKISDIKPPAEN